MHTQNSKGSISPWRTSDEVVDAVDALLVAFQREVRRRLAHAPHLSGSIHHDRGHLPNQVTAMRSAQDSRVWQQSRHTCLSEDPGHERRKIQRPTPGKGSTSHVCAQMGGRIRRRFSRQNADLDGAVQGRAGEGVGVLRVEHALHDVVRVALEYLRARPALRAANAGQREREPLLKLPQPFKPPSWHVTRANSPPTASCSSSCISLVTTFDRRTPPVNLSAVMQL